MSRILLVDDEQSIRRIVEQTLSKEGFEVVSAGDGMEAQEKFQKVSPDLVILDIMLPGIHGFELCRRWTQASAVPILILSAKGDIVDKSIGFNHGADDYLTKPFSPVELILRVKALLRRSRGSTGPETETAIKLPGLEIDGLEHTVRVEGQPVELTPKEFDLLWYLARHPDRAFTREHLFKQIWHEEAIGDTSTVTVFMRRLRQKVERNPDKPRYLKTVWGVGYKFAKE
ncbi:transcriptional regulator [Clostridiales bacterium PH28_bin88]|nr:transcriptional regulator [Clostridiales bacterium PH28_bin88]